MRAPTSYQAAFAQFAQGLPAAERALREQAFASFAAAGFPDDSAERWHYTDLNKLAPQNVQLPATLGAPALDELLLPGCESRVWLNGRAQQAAAGGEMPSGAGDALVQLNRAFALPGLQLQLAAGEQRAQPLHALLLTQAQAPGEMHHLAHRIALARGSRATVLLHSAGLPGAASFSSHQLDLDLAEQAQLTLICLQQEGEQAAQLLQTRARIGRDAQLRLINLDFGGQLIRKDWQLQLAEAGAQLEVHGLFAAQQRVHLDNQYEVEHAAPHTSSRQLLRGLGSGRSKSILNDRVLVRPGAFKTDSEQRLANLILERGAEINAKPELEIYADDVKCAHGNSCGQLDERAVFYLRSRGVPEAQARALLTYSFADAVLAQLPIAALRLRLAQTLTRQLGAELDFEDLT
ncbi:Fe-S cluster assembly protein SufD [Solimonas aquatica]|uniref:Fe-S cluster assembly protein SufD n=1 Tax=Solimonas aquatica TaxID=489703 RepID=A0A1H9D2K9_9GAMM|nr:SufD family Fe-S cluster assembly protein [Solimonas aquatica]SEQ07621.1 Fe-S cluster assembly protein SufD [Solimonas aquatica]